MVHLQRTLLNSPAVGERWGGEERGGEGREVWAQMPYTMSPLYFSCPVSIGLIWDSDASHVDRIRNVVNSIGLTLTVSEVSAAAVLFGNCSLLSMHWTPLPFPFLPSRPSLPS